MRIEEIVWLRSVVDKLAMADRYLVVLFIYKPETGEALVLSARDMARKERRQYGRK